MKKYNLITPEGTRDLLFEESFTLRDIENKICKVFKQRGYTEVITPAIEFYDVFNSTVRYFSQESLYKLTDSKGRLMVMRPDSTMPIARLAATRLRKEKLPLKLFYSQNIFRVNPKNSGRDDEISQSGIEIIGGDTKRSDSEAINIALRVMETIDSYRESEKGTYRFEIGDCFFFKRLISLLSEIIPLENGEKTEEIRVFVETKNYPELNKMLGEYEKKVEGDDLKWVVNALKVLPELFGGVEVFEKAEEVFKDNEMLAAVEDLKKLFGEICDLGFSDKLFVDFGMVSKINYYTGIIFKGYIEGEGKSILSGGRYDTLLSEFGVCQPAIGFAVNIDAVFPIKSEIEKPDVLVFYEEGFLVNGVKHIRKLISDGYMVSNALFNTLEEAAEYGRSRGIKRLDRVVGDKVETIKL